MNYGSLFGVLPGLMIVCLSGCQNPATEILKNRNASLSGLSVSSGVLTPSFSAEVTAYTVGVANAVSSITVTGVTQDKSAHLSANNAVSQSLSPGVNTITLTVTAEDTAFSKTYSVTVTRSFDYVSSHIGLLKYIPGGTFHRDVPTSANTSQVGGFRMAIAEITRSQYAGTMGSDPSDPAYSTGSSHPVQMVTWYDAVEFCNKLSVAEGLAPVYAITARTPAVGYPITSAEVSADWTAVGYRLPTEAEWMWSAMGATDTPEKPFSGSTGTNLFATYATADTTGTTPVGSKSANELGLFDMSGNVWEWSWDYYAEVPAGPLSDYRGPATGTDRVRRGGSWLGAESNCTVAMRKNGTPSVQATTFGFRVVRN